MLSLPDRDESFSPLVAAALLLAANQRAEPLDLPHPTLDQILNATGATRSRAYELRDQLNAVLPTLQRRVGRPATAPATPTKTEHEVSFAIARDVLGFVIAHPGCVAGQHRRHYTDVFRRYVLDLHARHSALAIVRFSEAVHVPLETLEDWLRAGDIDADGEATSDGNIKTDAAIASRDASPWIIQTVLSEWKKWHGAFTGFCDHLRENCAVPYGATLVSGILSSHGERTPARRQGRSPDERALRGAFETFFPNAQWVGDGTLLSIVMCGVRFDCNLELMVDPYSGAFVGASIRDEEDSAAVIEAFDDAKATTNGSPLAALLDNKPSNHTPDVDDALNATARIRATVERPQNKAHVEGAFGLFKTTAPDLVIGGADARALALSIVRLVVTTYFRAANHRPRADRKGRSRVEIHGDTPSPEQIEHARKALAERARRQHLARQTLEARQRPDVRKYLDDVFVRLALLDPERSVRIAIARYPSASITDGVAIFDGKRMANTLPPGIDARYLLGIVKNNSAMEEGMAIFEALLRERRKMRDLLLEGLERDRETILRETPSPEEHTKIFAERACDAAGQLH
ncbi:MAG TPA: transposase family protein, partial [Casimicrobiaceae bacterium]|nr:transposase family protein [Casimicrobiaceae bacterium]